MKRLALSLLLPLLAFAVRAELREVPRPLLDNLESSVREQLLAERAAVDALVSAGAERQQLAEAFLALGRLYYVNDLYRSSEAAFQNALELEPGGFEPRYFLGTIYFAEARFEESQSMLESGLAVRSDYLACWIRLGKTALELGRLDVAERAFSGALEVAPENAAAEHGLGRVAFESGDFNSAIERFERALELQPEANQVHYQLGLAYRELGDSPRALEHLKQNLHQEVRYEDPLIHNLYLIVYSAKLHFNSAIDLLQQNQTELAVEQLRMAIAKEPGKFTYHHNLAAALGLLDRAEEAEAEYRKALEFNPEYPNSHFNLAMLLAGQGNIEEGARHLELAHRYDPEDLVAHTEWATALSQLGDPRRAADELRKVLERDPGHAKARLNLATILAQLGDSSAAERELTLLLDSDPNAEEQSAALFRLGKILELQGEEDGALANYRRSLELTEELVEAHVAAAGILARRRQFAEAASHFGRATELDPEDLASHFGQGLALVLGERYLDAKRALETSAELHPDHWPVIHLLARLLATAPDAAARDGNKALELAEQVFSQQQTLEHAETIAMALAELGRFEDAAQWQNNVLAEARRRSDTGLMGTLERRLQQYQRGEPVRAPWHG